MLFPCGSILEIATKGGGGGRGARGEEPRKK